MIEYINEDGVKQESIHLIVRLIVLWNVLKENRPKKQVKACKIDAVLTGRRDEEKSRAKERIFFRNELRAWIPRIRDRNVEIVISKIKKEKAFEYSHF